ncbi:hypothetical protein ABPG74_005554 [Tetrahymena malaccensis]
MYKEKQLFWISFFYYLTNIYSMIVAILLYIERNELAYFIAFFSIFAIDKIVSLTFMYGCLRKMIFWVCDIFQLGFIYIFLVDRFFEGVTGSLILKIPSRLVPQVFLEFVFFFCLGTLDNDDSISYVQILALINFLLFLTLFFTYSSILSLNNNSYITFKQKALVVFKYFYFTATFYITLCALTFYKDCFGINLGYYQFLIIFLNIMLYLITKYPKIVWRDQRDVDFFLKYILTTQFLNKYSFYKQIKKDEKESKIQNFQNIIGYFNQIFRILLIICFNSDYIFSEQMLQGNNLKNGFTYATFIMSLIYFLFELHSVYYSIFRVRVFSVYNLVQIQKISQDLQKKSYDSVFMKFYKLQLPDQQEQLEKPLIENSNILKEEIFNLLKLQKKYIQENKKFQFKYEKIYFEEFYEDIIVSFPDLYESLTFQILYKLRREKKLIDIYYQRFFKGFAFTQISRDIRKEVLIYQAVDIVIIANALSLTCFTKYFQRHMTFQSPQILYDLYQSY